MNTVEQRLEKLERSLSRYRKFTFVLRIVPGSHRRPKKAFRESDLYGLSVPVSMPRGGVLLFNDCCFHGSDVNIRDGSSRSLTLAYRAHDVIKEDPEKTLVGGERVYTGHPFT